MPVAVSTGYQDNLGDIRTAVRSHLRKTSSDEVWTDEQLNECINRALDELRIHGFEQIAQDTFTTTADQQNKILSATVWKVIGLNYDDEYLVPITQRQMDELTGGDWDASSGDPDYWFIESTENGAKVWFDKQMPTGKTVKYWYVKRPQNLSSDSELSGFYKTFTVLVVYKAVALAHADRGNTTEWQMWTAIFDNLIELALHHSVNPHKGDLPPIDPYGWSDVS